MHKVVLFIPIIVLMFAIVTVGNVYASHNNKHKYAEEAKKKAIEELKTKQMNYKINKELSKKPCFKSEHPGSFTASKPC